MSPILNLHFWTKRAANCTLALIRTIISRQLRSMASTIAVSLQKAIMGVLQLSTRSSYHSSVLRVCSHLKGFKCMIHMQYGTKAHYVLLIIDSFWSTFSLSLVSSEPSLIYPLAEKGRTITVKEGSDFQFQCVFKGLYVSSEIVEVQPHYLITLISLLVSH